MGKLLKSAAVAVTGLALAASAGAATALPADAAAGCNANFTTYNTVQKGYKGTQAKSVECLLVKAGYKATVNGNISAADADQIAKFRKSVGLDSVKAVGRRGWGALISHGTTPNLTAGAKGANVLRVQLALRGGGYKATPATSTLDGATVKVLKQAQKDNKLSQTGTVNAKTWKALQSGRLVVPLKATVKKPTVKKPTVKKASSTSKGEKALAFAKKQLGEKYRYGAAGPNAWDCSGLTMKAWKAAGKSLPHNAKAQYKKGKKVSKSSLKKGDLVFFYSGPSHVGIYAGGGKIIHASRPGKPVAYIKIKYMPYKGARRP
jgi:cell wall-associated NlpC family hydrolase